MAGNLTNALWITLIGMGLVFIAILALWGLMALIVRLTAERQEAPEAVSEEEAPAEAAPTEVALEAAAPVAAAPLKAGSHSDLKRRAAAAAVAVALQLRRPAAPARSNEPAVSVSAWQAVQRAGQLSQRFQTSRKKVVR